MKKCLSVMSRWLCLLLYGVALATGGAGSAWADEVIFNSWNGDGTYNNPTVDPVFTLSKATTISKISNYHWNNYAGQDASLVNGWIGIDQVISASESVSIGRWPATSTDGAFGSKNTWWLAYPNIQLAPGTYKVTDSNRETWSYTVSDYYHMGNDWAAYKGFSEIWAAPATCVNPPAGLVGWWPGNGNADDIIGGHNGTLSGAVGFAGGEVGQAFSYPRGGQGVIQGVRVPAAPALDVKSVITIDAWIKPNSSVGPIVQFSWPHAYGAHFWLWPNPNSLFANLVDVYGGWHRIEAPGVIETGVLQHVAVTYDKASGIAKLYKNGALVAEQSLGSFDMKTNEGLEIGMRDDHYANDGSFSGLIDEVDIFNRALTPAEINAIYLAGSAGKCLNVNHPPVARTGADQAVELASCTGASVNLDGSGSTDPDGDILTYTWTWPGGSATGANPTVTLPHGTTTITLMVDDNRGAMATATVTVTVVDSKAPTLRVTTTPTVLWPANHKLVQVTPTVTVTDACLATTTTALVSVTSNESDNGLGDGDTANDIVTNPDGTFSLRAERSGSGSGRVYTLTYSATDIDGNNTTAAATITVPHNK